MDPFTLATAIVGVIGVAQTVAQMTFGYVGDVKGYPEEFNKLVVGTRELYGVLCSIRPVIERLEAQDPRRSGISPP